MENVKRRQWLIFGATCLIVGLVLLLKMSALWPLYFDVGLRQRTLTLVQGTAAREGWLLSDVELQHVSPASVKLYHRSHLRGPDPIACYRLNLYNGQLESCVPY